MEPRSPDEKGVDLNPDRQVGIADLRRLWKVERGTAFARVNKDDAPEPIDRLATGAVWRLGDWIRYEQESPNAANWRVGTRIVPKQKI